MSFLMFLLISSLVYLTQADPIEDVKNEQSQVEKFVAVIGKEYDVYIAPLLESLGKEDQDFFKLTNLDGIGGLLNYSLYLAKSQPILENPFDEQDVIFEFEAVESPLPLIPQTTPSVE